MKMIKLSVSFLIVLFVALGGCSKSSPPAPAPQAPKKAASPVVPATPPKMVTSMATSSTLSKTAPPLSLKPAVAVTTGAAPTAPLRTAPSSVAAMPNVALTSTITTTAPAKLLESSPVYSYNPEGKKDPFMTFLQGANPSKAVKASIPLLNYSLGDLKLVAVMILKKNKFLAMVQTPDSKGYVVKPGMEIGINHGRVREITDHSISVEEEFTEIGGEKKKRTVVLSLRPPEEGQL